MRRPTRRVVSKVCGAGHGEGTGSKCLSTLCVPPGVGKRLPLIVHSGGNTLYEEPCLEYLNLHVAEVRHSHLRLYDDV